MTRQNVPKIDELMASTKQSFINHFSSMIAALWSFQELLHDTRYCTNTWLPFTSVSLVLYCYREIIRSFFFWGLYSWMGFCGTSSFNLCSDCSVYDTQNRFFFLSQASIFRNFYTAYKITEFTRTRASFTLVA